MFRFIGPFFNFEKKIDFNQKYNMIQKILILIKNIIWYKKSLTGKRKLQYFKIYPMYFI